MKILGISAFYHDSAVCLLDRGEIVFAAQEERFSRRKNDPNFPVQSLEACFEYSGLSLEDINYVVFYDKPFLKFERILETILARAPHGYDLFKKAIPIWGKEKLFLRSTIKRELSAFKNDPQSEDPHLLFNQHHRSHAASAFFPSPFEEAAVLTIDGVGEWATTVSWMGKKNTLIPIQEINFPHSLGLLYSAFTAYCGFEVNSGEYKLMGLAPYGSPKYKELIYDHLIDVKLDGSYRLNLEYFSFCDRFEMTNEKFDQLFGRPARRKGEDLLNDRFYADIASSIQVVLEEVLVKMTKSLHDKTGQDNLCLAGGVALNCFSNEAIRKKSGFKNVWIQPAAGDAGGALGAALSCWYEYHCHSRKITETDSMQNAYLGEEYFDDQVKVVLDYFDTNYSYYENYNDIYEKTAELLDKGHIIGWFQGRMEFGPRGLGHRSILADARREDMQLNLNLKIKSRESFWPFAPSVLADFSEEYFEGKKESPYMLFISETKDKERFPGITHVDGSARRQTVDSSGCFHFYQLLKNFYDKTSCPLIMNTSFNTKDGPIVSSPKDALKCFIKTNMDALVIGRFILRKKQQPSQVLTAVDLDDEKINSTPQATKAELRNFALSVGPALAIILGVIFPSLISRSWLVLWPLVGVGGIISIVGLFSPKTWRPFYAPWMAIVRVLGEFNAKVTLTLIYYLVLVPAGFLWQRFGRTLFVSKFRDTNLESYWSEISPDKERRIQEQMKDVY